MERSKKEYEKDIMKSLNWLGIVYDGEVWRQSERGAIYREFLQKLIDSGAAYISTEQPKEEGQRSSVVRFRNPHKIVAFEDLVRGRVSIDTTDLSDFVIAKSMDEPLYHLAVVVDDALANVTHIIRGEDHISNTPRQILIQEALGFPRPVYAHLPLILADDRSKLSKRKHGERVSLKYYIEKGYLKEAIINYIALLGWNPGTDQEIFTFDELLKTFDISKVQKGGAIFDEEKLKWVNREHLKLLPLKELKQNIKNCIEEKDYFKKKNWDLNNDLLEKIIPILMERINTFMDIGTMLEAGELDYFFEQPVLDSSMIIWKDSVKEETAQNLKKIIELLSSFTEREGEWSTARIKDVIWPYAEAKGKGSILWPMRFALSGKEKSPDPFTLAYALGKIETLKRLENALEILR